MPWYAPKRISTRASFGWSENRPKRVRMPAREQIIVNTMRGGTEMADGLSSTSIIVRRRKRIAKIIRPSPMASMG